MKNYSQKNNYIFSLAIWIIYLLASFLVIHWLIKLNASSGLVPTTSYFLITMPGNYYYIFYIVLVFLTSWISFARNSGDFSNKLKNTIILNFLVIFLFYAFYQIISARLSAYYLVPFDFCGADAITDFELVICSTQAQILFYVSALVKTIFVGSILAAIYLVFDRLIKNKEN